MNDDRVQVIKPCARNMTLELDIADEALFGECEALTKSTNDLIRTEAMRGRATKSIALSTRRRPDQWGPRLV